MPRPSIEETLEFEKDSIMALPGVVGIGIGELKGQLCIRVFVDGDAEAAQSKIPSELGGYPIDVVESGPFEALDPV